ncbi:MAG: MerR family transcriptional regulator [Bacteroidetes bacterium]|nr:MerR family transcriptional regulator [Bacteroidota bacterium]
MADYKIKDIENLTGIKAHTLRIWEKRYNIVAPDRNDGKIRMYSDAELKLILNVALLNKNGLKISRISELTSEQQSAKVAEIFLKGNHDTYFERLLISLLNFDEELFVKTLDQMILEQGLEFTFSKYITEFLEKVGVLWLTGTIHPGQEHFISNLIRQKIFSQIDQSPIPSSECGHVILFLAEHEWHEISLLFYHYVFRINGIYSFYLGQSTPIDSIEKCIEKFKPKALVTSFITGIEDKELENYFLPITEKYPEVAIYAGGIQMKNRSEKLNEIIQPIQKYEDLMGLVKRLKSI